MKHPKGRKIVIEVRYDGSHRLESVIHTVPELRNCGSDINNVVIDRENNRGPIDAASLIARAQMLAHLLGIKFVQTEENRVLFSPRYLIIVAAGGTNGRTSTNLLRCFPLRFSGLHHPLASLESKIGHSCGKVYVLR